MGIIYTYQMIFLTFIYIFNNVLLAQESEFFLFSYLVKS
jgi:hypothetical protein